MRFTYNVLHSYRAGLVALLPEINMDLWMDG